MLTRQIESIVDTQACCGCGSCFQRCPQKCISLKADNEGFMYPIINKNECIDCGLCDKVCPVLNSSTPHEPLSVYAAINKDEKIRLQSSSGGIFSLLAEKIISEGGVVFGARFDEQWQVKLDYTETIEGIAAFRGSKYVQARTENSFNLAENFLRQGRKVLFSGTPCQIAGLKKMLRKEYDNLLTIDCACYGVPSPKVWERYIKESTSNQPHAISSISFRDKFSGWRNYSFSIRCHTNEKLRQNRYENIYLRSFNLMLRPSCYSCKAKGVCSVADITLADFWSIHRFSPDMDDDKGVGLVIIHTDKGKDFYPIEKTIYEEHTFEQGAMENGGLNCCAIPHPKRNLFFEKLDQANNLEAWIKEISARSFVTMCKDKVYWTLYKLFNKK